MRQGKQNKTTINKGDFMNSKFYMMLLKAKHQAEDELLSIKKEKELFIAKLGKETKITKVIGNQLKDFDKRMNIARNHIRSLKQRLRNG